jgi:triphosphatase
MASEVELKLEVPLAMLRALSRRLEPEAEGPVRRRKLVSVYFDTRKRALLQEGLTLRVRRAGDRIFQTVKGPGDFHRQEWEKEIDGEMPERGMARHTALKPFTSKKQWRKLRPLFETDVARVSVPVKSGKSRIEIAFDRGKVIAGGTRPGGVGPALQGRARLCPG